MSASRSRTATKPVSSTAQSYRWESSHRTCTPATRSFSPTARTFPPATSTPSATFNAENRCSSSRHCSQARSSSSEGSAGSSHWSASRSTLPVLTVFVLPALLQGEDPLAVALVGAATVGFMVLYLAHGVSIRTTIAVLGSFASLALTGLLGWLFVGATHLTGQFGEEQSFLVSFGSNIDFQGLLLAGIVIGTLGVLDDVTVTQVSAVAELHTADPTMGSARLYSAGVRIGRDHIASTVNTLVLAYAGASLPLLLLFVVTSQGAGTTITSEIVAIEIVRTLVGSIGLVAAVPLTTYLATLVTAGARPHLRDPWLRSMKQRSPTTLDLDAPPADL